MRRCLQFPFLAAASVFKILSGAVSTMARMQFVQITKLFEAEDASMLQLRQLIFNMVITRVLQIAVARVETKLTENGVQAFRYTLWRKTYRKL
eukprot:SAG31_NODE_722_length_12572_cov_2.409124_3_plen_93_part_00